MRCLLTDPVVGEPLLDPVVDLTQLQLLGGTVADGHGCKGGHDIILLSTLTTNFRYCRLGDLNLEPATLCACAGGEQQTIIKIVIHFL